MIVVLPVTHVNLVSLFRVIYEGVPYVVREDCSLYESFRMTIDNLHEAYQGREVRIPEWF